MLPEIPDLGDFIPTQTLKLESEKLPFKKNISNIKREICTHTCVQMHTSFNDPEMWDWSFVEGFVDVGILIIVCVSRIVAKKMGPCKNDLGSHHSFAIQGILIQKISQRPRAPLTDIYPYPFSRLQESESFSQWCRSPILIRIVEYPRFFPKPLQLMWGSQSRFTFYQQTSNTQLGFGNHYEIHSDEDVGSDSIQNTRNSISITAEETR